MPFSPGHNQSLSTHENMSTYSYIHIWQVPRSSTYLVQYLCDYHSVHWFKLSRVQVPPCYLSLVIFSKFLSNCLLSLSLLSFFPLDFVQFLSKFAIPLCFLSFTSFYSYAITLLPQQNFNIYYPSLLFTYCVWCCAWCNRRRGP